MPRRNVVPMIIYLSVAFLWAAPIAGCGMKAEDRCPADYMWDSESGVCISVYQDAAPPDAGEVVDSAVEDDSTVTDDGTVTEDGGGNSGLGDPCVDSSDCTGDANFCGYNVTADTWYCTYENCTPGSCPTDYVCCDCTPQGPVLCATIADTMALQFCACEPVP